MAEEEPVDLQMEGEAPAEEFPAEAEGDVPLEAEEGAELEPTRKYYLAYDLFPTKVVKLSFSMWMQPMGIFKKRLLMAAKEVTKGVAIM